MLNRTIEDLSPDSPFHGLSEDDGTTTLARKEMHIDAQSVLFEAWLADGIYGESIIFPVADVAGKDDAALETLVRATPAPKEDTQFTVSRGSRFVHVNFNFRAPPYDDD